MLIAGNGLLSTLTPLRGKLDGFSPFAIGLLGSVYFFGMLGGTLLAPAVVRRAGYIRAFSAFTSLAIVDALAYPVLPDPVAWIVLRGGLGLAFAGLYGVIDAWLAAKSRNAERGRTYGLYQIVNFAGSAGGQQVLTVADPRSFGLFSLAAGLFALAILPLAFTATDPPAAPRSATIRLRWLFATSPVGAVAALFIGAANGSLWSLGPVYALGLGFSPSQAASFMTCVVLGSAIAVYPVGRLSDAFDRRHVLCASALVGAVVEVALGRGLGLGLVAVSALGVALGASTSTLYTLAVAHTNDRAPSEHAVGVSAGLLFLYCVGAIVGPTSGSALMAALGAPALFMQNAVLHVALAGFTLRRILARAAPPPIVRDAAGELGPGVP